MTLNNIWLTYIPIEPGGTNDDKGEGKRQEALKRYWMPNREVVVIVEPAE